MDDLLDIYDDIASGDVARARRRIQTAKEAGADPDAVADLQAFLDAPPGDLATGAAIDADLTHPGSIAPPRRDAVPFSCLACGHEEHYVRQVLLDRRWASLGGWDAVDRSVRTYGCAACGHIAWFGPAAPGAFQQEVPEDEPQCRCCGHGTLRRGDALFGPRGWALLGLDALAGQAKVDACVRCGHLHWSADASPGQRQAPGPGDGCLACGGATFTRRPIRLDRRAVTFLGWDWPEHGADCLRCRDCGALRWQGR